MSVKPCSTCEHNKGGRSEFAKCLIEAGSRYSSLSRRYTGGCGAVGKFWTPRRGVLQRIKDWLFGPSADPDPTILSQLIERGKAEVQHG